MAGRHHRGNEEKRDEGRRRTGSDILKERIGKAADSRISSYIIIKNNIKTLLKQGQNETRIW
jgi:hypothetical protein